MNNTTILHQEDASVIKESNRPRLTTKDNPFDPFGNFNEWYAFDSARGYHSLSLLARVCRSSEDLTEAEEEEAIIEAIDEVVHYNLSGIHQKVYPSDFKNGRRKTLIV